MQNSVHLSWLFLTTRCCCVTSTVSLETISPAVSMLHSVPGEHGACSRGAAQGFAAWSMGAAAVLSTLAPPLVGPSSLGTWSLVPLDLLFPWGSCTPLVSISTLAWTVCTERCARVKLLHPSPLFPDNRSVQIVCSHRDIGPITMYLS